MKKLILTNLPYLMFVYPFDKVSQAAEAAAKSGPEKKPSIRERLEDAKRECSERKPPEKGRPGREAPEYGNL